MTATHVTALKAASILWIIWGIVHAFFGVGIITADAPTGFAYIAAAVAPEALNADYHVAIGAILNQHGWNLLWFGGATTIAGVLIWRRNVTSIWVAAMVGGLADFGYLAFVDFGGYANFFPGTLMTLIAGSAIMLSFWAWSTQRNRDE